MTGASGTCFFILPGDVGWEQARAHVRQMPDGAEHALEEWRARRALWFAGEPGWFALTLRPGDNPGSLEAFVLLAVSRRPGAFEAAEPAVLAIARDLGATTVAFRSARRGWSRKLGPQWKPRGAREFWRDINER